MTVQLLKEQNKYDQIPLGLFNQLKRVLSPMDVAKDAVVLENTDVFKEHIPRMFEVMQKVAKYSCDYVRCGRLGR